MKKDSRYRQGKKEITMNKELEQFFLEKMGILEHHVEALPGSKVDDRVWRIYKDGVREESVDLVFNNDQLIYVVIRYQRKANNGSKTKVRRKENESRSERRRKRKAKDVGDRVGDE